MDCKPRSVLLVFTGFYFCFNYHTLITYFPVFTIKKGGVLGATSANYLYHLPPWHVARLFDEEKTPLWKLWYDDWFPEGGTVYTAVGECILHA